LCVVGAMKFGRRERNALPYGVGGGRRGETVERFAIDKSPAVCYNDPIQSTHTKEVIVCKRYSQRQI
jgi:hypothetical protein